jgi:hypothetical protein
MVQVKGHKGATIRHTPWTPANGLARFLSGGWPCFRFIPQRPGYIVVFLEVILRFNAKGVPFALVLLRSMDWVG